MHPILRYGIIRAKMAMKKSEFKDCNLYGLTDEEREIVKGGEK